MEQKKNRTLRNSVIVAAVIIVAIAVWYFALRTTETPFCFDFVHDTQFGDRVVAKASNVGHIAPSGATIYYIPEVPALQTALEREGFYIDAFEKTGGGVYVTSFFGPTTRTAVMAFQKKHGLSETGQVTNDVIDVLSARYACPRGAATSTPSDYSFATTTPKK
ncbi:MAG TPA: peptidoglycan-binding domain-containing protein [Candidatus Paceibacterota bacterium]|nr:peptidoglycan-binding domain-containing protein [Candidatus Paceibacterota bacterium]